MKWPTGETSTSWPNTHWAPAESAPLIAEIMPSPLLIDSPVLADIQKITAAMATTANQPRAIFAERERWWVEEVFMGPSG